ncbi:MAG: hypothetical protein N2745_05045 [Syntrophorhabdaceae bacterium]|nr:hypothetical protein [Syntrophorhabdaceae bacterium]
MEIQTVSSTQGNKNQNQTRSTNLVDKDAFLKILISQIKYQDPLNPMKADEFLNQLSQLTQVEQLQNISSTLDGMKQSWEKGNITQWISTIGKKVNVESSNLSKGDSVYLTPEGDFDEVLLTIKSLEDGSVKEVRFKKGEPLVYTHESDGSATIAAVAYKGNKVVNCKTSSYRIVKGIDMRDGKIMLIAGSGESYPADTVKQIKE